MQGHLAWHRWYVAIFLWAMALVPAAAQVSRVDSLTALLEHDTLSADGSI